MSSNPKYALTIFRKEDEDLHKWYQRVDHPRVTRAQIGREAFECYRLCREMFGESWSVEVKEAGRALALVREMFGESWQDEWQKLKDIAAQM